MKYLLKMKQLRLLAGVLLLSAASYSNAGWSPFYEITSNYFQPIGTTDQTIILTFPAAFHSCGWDTAAEVKASEVGQDYFNTISSVILAAILADKKVSLLTSDVAGEYCVSSRANIIGIRMAH